MKEQLLQLIKTAELLRAKALVNNNADLAEAMREALKEFYYAYQELTKYE